MKGMVSVAVFIGMLFAAYQPAQCVSDRLKVPRVEYAEPNNDSAVDITGKTILVFRWKSQPIPGGGREAYRFRLYKGFGYSAIYAKDLEGGVFSLEVPAEKFEDGNTYSWHVEQRDSSSMAWSIPDTWSFKVIKKQ